MHNDWKVRHIVALFFAQPVNVRARSRLVEACNGPADYSNRHRLHRQGYHVLVEQLLPLGHHISFLDSLLLFCPLNASLRMLVPKLVVSLLPLNESLARLIGDGLG